ncbi:MAG: CocE/NonD family hydrolase [Myxococcales bacterium]|nr:CocE/NonD family hydrolase [Myxococcales bacterium]
MKSSVRIVLVMACASWIGCSSGPGATVRPAATSPTQAAGGLAPPAPKIAPDPVPARPVSLAGFEDRGTFLVYKNEERIASARFEWKSSGEFTSHSALSLAGQVVETTLTIETDPEGLFRRIVLSTPLGPATLERDGERATAAFRSQKTEIALKPGTLLFENFSPALMSLGVRSYNRKKGGAQTFPALVVPGAMLEATIGFQDEVERAPGGKPGTFRRYIFSIAGVDIRLWADERDRIVLAEVPAQYARFVREGYDGLGVEPSTATVSQPEFSVMVERDWMIPMRDGVRLATDLYRPETREPVPLILIRTPYQKTMLELTARFYARRGYAVAVQDCRGRFKSEGVWEPFVNEALDGYDTIEFLAGQPFCSGKVGMIGGSYLGWVQWWAAREKPPHLVTIIPNVSPPDPLYNIPYEYGVFFLLGAIWWAEVVESEATADLSGAVLTRIGERKYTRLLQKLPVIDLDKEVFGHENAFWRKWIKHPTQDEYWDRASFLDKLCSVKMPVFHQSGWFDGDGIGTKLNYLAMRNCGHPFQKLILGPWGHTDTATRSIGDRDFGPHAIIDLQTEYLRWFDRWLKGVENGIDKEPLVRLFVMGDNRWLEGERYPLPGAKMTPFYFSSEKGAAGLGGDGLLSIEPPRKKSSYDSFVYDPGDPTPTPYFYEENIGDSPMPEEQSKVARKEHARTILSSRKDILVYRTPPLERPLTFAGPIEATLVASTSAPDTDWFVRLVEVDDKGTPFLLSEGKIRARYRKSLRNPELLKPDEVFAYRIDLWHTAITIPKGYRLQVEVASASFPFFSRNLNTGTDCETEVNSVKAHQKVFHGSGKPSFILLPVLQ